MRCFHPIEVREWQGEEVKRKTNSYRLVPCGKCVACLSRKRNDWTFRLQKERAGSDYSFFLTLTYNDENIPLRIVDDKPYFVFNKKHIQDYLKRVRYYVGELNSDITVRYYCVSEYGKKTQRPHYHMQLFVKNDKNLQYHKSICKILESNWDYGYFQRKVTDDANIHYVTKYCIKSLDEVDSRCIDMPFILCSKRPYLGECAEKDIEKQPFTIPVVFNNGVRNAMPRIYRQHLGFAGCSVPESEFDPRLNAVTYDEMYRDFKRLHEKSSFREFQIFVNDRLRSYEESAKRRQLTRQEKL